MNPGEHFWHNVTLREDNLLTLLKGCSRINPQPSRSLSRGSSSMPTRHAIQEFVSLEKAICRTPRQRISEVMLVMERYKDMQCVAVIGCPRSCYVALTVPKHAATCSRSLLFSQLSQVRRPPRRRSPWPPCKLCTRLRTRIQVGMHRLLQCTRSHVELQFAQLRCAKRKPQ